MKVPRHATDQPADRRTRKRSAMREAISNAATALFMERGFDAVTIDEIAAAADVGRITVFNHFPRKEDLFFDRDEEGRELLRATLRERGAGVTAIEAYRRRAHQLIAEQSPFLDFSERSQRFLATIEGSETLKARARAIRDDLARIVSQGLLESAGGTGGTPEANLGASLLVATWSTAFLEAHRTFRETGSPEQAATVFLGLIDKGAAGVRAALVGTPYA